MVLIYMGSRGLGAFPDPNKTYKSDTLFSAFKLRLKNKSRPDYLELLKEYDLNDTSSDLEILSATFGRLVTDNYEFVPTLSKCEKLDFYLAGWRCRFDRCHADFF